MCLIFWFLLDPPSLCKSSSSPSNSLSNLLLSYSMWMRMVVEWNGLLQGWEWRAFIAQNHQKIEQPWRKPKHPGVGGTHGRGSQAARPCIHQHRPRLTPRAAHGGLWLNGSVVFWTLRFCALPWFKGFCLRSSILGLLGLFCNLLWSIWPQFHSFHLLHGSIYLNLKSKTPNKPKQA